MESFNFGQVSTSSFVLMGIGAFIAIVVPIVIAIVWCRKKNEKIIQNVLIIPGQMGLPETPVSMFINARPFLLAFLLGLFPGVFEETGRLIAFKTILRKRTWRETSISYGIGHGGVEVVFAVGLSLISYIVLGSLINSGEAVKEFEETLKAMDQPWMIEQVTGQMKTITGFDLTSLCTLLIERVFAVLFHIGASILIDGIAALQIVQAVKIPSIAIEIIFVLASVATFLGSYLLLYKRDKAKEAGA